VPHLMTSSPAKAGDPVNTVVCDYWMPRLRRA
jgi:hypothetical protein